MEKIFRRATLEDREGVLSLSPDLYFGRDYLPHMYDSVIREYRGYVCEENGTIIGFGMISIVDGGETATRRGGRVLESHQGQGVFRDLSDYMTRDLYTIPNMKYSTMTINKKHFDLSRSYINRENYKLVMKIMIMLVNYNISDLQVTSSPVNNIVITEIDRDLFATILNCKPSRDYLFPEKFVRIHCVLYRPSMENLEHFLNEERYVVGSYGEKQRRPESIRLLTLASFFPCKVGTAYQIDIFGDKIEDFHAHLCLHFKKISTITKSFATSGIMFGMDMNIELIKSAFRQFNIASPGDTAFELSAYRKTLYEHSE
ncbi:hypothetical protein LOTGIDRAFT_160122 [Lottia gigantea]|uniref:N-acetyltransferase domain-containing protein n=1 Tax=Lottia gigantea TaxID=225164 RepID=V4AMY2_LOTGI|nr:hypothetical protein LOTGIDRAFT_160122 [Lottia gigantea]ESO96135.1 hypothetical protein LOTGIDRAFT_160122 [Lottia gigantea]